MEKTLKGTQCRNVIYLPPQNGEDFDLHLMKITDYYDDGSSERKIKLIKNYNKTVWVCNNQNRNHKQKKERFRVDLCEEIKSPRMNLFQECKRALGIKFGNPRPADILRGPYVYGSDLSSTAELKFKYNTRELAKDTKEFATVGAFDIEGNVRDPERPHHVDMASFTMGSTCITVVDFNFIRERYRTISKEMALEELKKLDEFYLSEINKERNIQSEFILVDSEIEVITTIFKRIHELKPDFISAWAMDYDITKIIDACERAGASLPDIFSDPKVPSQFRFFNYDPGRAQKSNDNKSTNLANHQRWPQVHTPASFTFIDSMCTYSSIRKHGGLLPSYKLDYILAREFPDDLKMRKLKFSAVKDSEGTIEWHRKMQAQYPLEYIIYNKFDCIALEYLDEQTNDIRHKLVSDCYYSDYSQFSSEPTRLANRFHWFNLSRGYAFGTGGANSVIPEDELLISKRDWIVALPAELLIEPGMNRFLDAPELTTNIFQDNGDIDVTSSYPNGNAAMNTSRETMVKELIEIEGVSEAVRRRAGINLIGGFVNSVTVSCDLFGLPGMSDVLSVWDSEQK